MAFISTLPDNGNYLDFFQDSDDYLDFFQDNGTHLDFFQDNGTYVDFCQDRRNTKRREKYMAHMGHHMFSFSSENYTDIRQTLNLSQG